MEEDIEILEEYINCGFNENEEIRAIKNLLTRYKQLEEENKSKQKAYDDCYCEYKHYKQFDSIPKSKVKEKIEELDKEEKRELKGTKGQDRYYIKQKYMYKRKVLEELLREE